MRRTLIALSAAAALALTACGAEDEAEEAGNAVENAAEEAGDAVENAADDVADEAAEGAEAVKEELDDKAEFKKVTSAADENSCQFLSQMDAEGHLEGTVTRDEARMTERLGETPENGGEIIQACQYTNEAGDRVSYHVEMLGAPAKDKLMAPVLSDGVTSEEFAVDVADAAKGYKISEEGQRLMTRVDAAVGNYIVVTAVEMDDADKAKDSAADLANKIADAAM